MVYDFSDPFSRYYAGCAASKKNCVDDGFFSQASADDFHLGFHSFDIGIDEVAGARGCVKIAVETPRPAEWDVDINAYKLVI